MIVSTGLNTAYCNTATLHQRMNRLYIEKTMTSL